VFVGLIEAATLNVPSEYSTWGEAIVASQFGDEIVTAPEHICQPGVMLQPKAGTTFKQGTVDCSLLPTAIYVGGYYGEKSDIRFEGVTFINGRVAVEVSTTTVVKNITFLNCIFTQQSKHAIKVWGGEDITIAGCVFEEIGRYDPLYPLTRFNPPILMNGTIGALVIDNVTMRTGAIRLNKCIAVIKGNECIDNPFLAISVVDPINVQIRGNVIHSMMPEPPCCAQGDKTGIGVPSNIGGGYVLIEDNIIGPRDPGIWITGPSNSSLPRMGPIVIRGNIFEECENAAMVINRGIDVVTIENNFVSDFTGTKGVIQLIDVTLAVIKNNVYESLEVPFIKVWGEEVTVEEENNIELR